MAGTYVSAHLYTDEAIRRCVESGVHSLEHCNLIQPETAQLAAAKGAVAVPTLVTYDKLASEGGKLGFPPEFGRQGRDMSARPAWNSLDDHAQGRARHGLWQRPARRDAPPPVGGVRHPRPRPAGP